MAEIIDIGLLKKEYNNLKSEIEVLQISIDELEAQKQVKYSILKKLEEQISSKVIESHAESFDANWNSSTEFNWSNEVLKITSDLFKFTSLRESQLQVINATMSQRNVFVLMKTGGGKSLCYQLPSLLAQGITVVIAPLVSLIRDQVRCMNDLIANSAVMLAGKVDLSDQKIILNRMINDNSLKLVYATPEKVQKSKQFISTLQKVYNQKRLSRIVIDEAHCASQWGHDFRPDYAALGCLKKMFSDVPILALTATASSTVMNDVLRILNIDGNFQLSSYIFSDIDAISNIPRVIYPTMLPPVIFLGDFDRPNLKFAVWKKPESYDRQIDLVAEALNLAQGKSVIIYCFTQKETEILSLTLSQRGFSVASYHAGVDEEQRNIVQDKWQSNRIQIICATIAFGLGINKTDVRLVLHFNISKSLELYYQEAGRAGRDGHPSHCIILYHPHDVLRITTVSSDDLELLSNGSTRHKVMSMIRYCQTPYLCRRSIMKRHLNNHHGKNYSNTVDSFANCQCDRCLVSESDSLNDNLYNIWHQVDNAVILGIVTAITKAQKEASSASDWLTLKKLQGLSSIKAVMAKYQLLPW